MSTSIDIRESTKSPSKSSLRGLSVNPEQSDKNLKSSTHSTPATAYKSLATSSPPPVGSAPEKEDGEQSFFPQVALSDHVVGQPQLSFQPFFTLIQDSVTNEHYHPTVHYIFADDDTDVLTEAACRSIELSENSRELEDTTVEYHTSEQEGTLYSDTRLPKSQPGVREHYLILDVQPVFADSDQTQAANIASDRLCSPVPGSFETARNVNLQTPSKNYPYCVAAVQSLSSDWQITSTTMTDAPTMNGEVEDAAHDNFMLRISGSSNIAESKLPGRKDGESLEDMIDRFRGNLSEIRRLMQVDEGVHRLEDDIEPHQGLLRQAGMTFGATVLDEQD